QAEVVVRVGDAPPAAAAGVDHEDAGRSAAVGLRAGAPQGADQVSASGGEEAAVLDSREGRDAQGRQQADDDEGGERFEQRVAARLARGAHSTSRSKNEAHAQAVETAGRITNTYLASDRYFLRGSAEKWCGERSHPVLPPPLRLGCSPDRPGRQPFVDGARSGRYDPRSARVS